MPTVIIEFLSGRTVEQKSRLAKAITDDIAEILGVRREAITVIFHELSKENTALAGVLLSERDKQV